MKPNFRQLKLGYASATEEGTKSPELLLEGYLNVSGFFEEARDGDKFLFLGNKGSGKTALAEHLRLTAEKESNLFVKTIFREAKIMIRNTLLLGHGF